MYNTEPDKDFFPIPVTAIDTNMVSRFDLFLSVRPDEPLVLYSHKGGKFDPETIEEIQKMNILELFVPAQQVEDFRCFVEETLPTFLDDDDASLAGKSEILYACCNHNVASVFESIGDRENIRRCKELLVHTVRFMNSNRGVLQAVLKQISKDYSVVAHSTIGCFMSIALARQMGIEHPSHLRHIGLGAMLRDLGMTMLDTSILEARGRLTMDEFRQIKQHPEFGEKIVQDVDIITDVERDIIRQHHERLDGSGYPKGAAGKSIPMHVRIVSVSDVFCALTVDRPFQPSMSTFDALKFMTDTMKGELDATILKSLVKTLCIGS